MQTKPKLNTTLMATAAMLTGVFVLSAVKPAEAQRKSIRWATSSVDSYGYKVAASMVKIVEQALGGQYTITVNPYPSTTGAMKAAMDGNGEIGYTADIGMSQLYAGEGGFKGYNPGKGRLVHSWYAYPMESFMATSAAQAGKFKCWSDFGGKPVFYTTAGFMNWLNFQRITKTLGYQFKHVQIDPKTQSDALQAELLSALSPTPQRAARSRPTGRRPMSGWMSRLSILARTSSPSSNRRALRSQRSIQRMRSRKMSA
jgi:TRAP-type uncharacterized transport system substrate-binding protein